MLSRRLLSAAAGIPVLIAVVAIGGPLFDVTLALVLAATTVEVLVHAGVDSRDPRLWGAGAAAAALTLVVQAPFDWSASVLTVFIVFTLVASLPEVRASERLEHWSLSLAITLYVGWLGRYLALVRNGIDGRAWLFFTLFVTFASDTGAYVVGRLVGRHRLAPSISPAKTVEGSIGGLLAAASAAVALGAILHLHVPALIMLAIGSGVSVAAQVGDLCESALKRRLDLKDAGSLVPGHGGLLDRLDSLLLTAAVVYYLVRWISL